MAEAVVRNGDVVAGDQHSGSRHLVCREIERLEMGFQGRTVGGAIPEPEVLDGSPLEAAALDIASGFGAPRTTQLVLEEGSRGFDQSEHPAALIDFGNVPLLELRHRHAGLRSKPLDSLRERQALGLHHKREDVAMLTRCEAVIEPLVIIDEERGRFLRLEG